MSIKSEVLYFVLLWSWTPVRCQSQNEYPDVWVIASIHIKELPQHLKKDVMSLSVSRYHSITRIQMSESSPVNICLSHHQKSDVRVFVSTQMSSLLHCHQSHLHLKDITVNTRRVHKCQSHFQATDIRVITSQVHVDVRVIYSTKLILPREASWLSTSSRISKYNYTHIMHVHLLLTKMRLYIGV